jgi:hypothetical protein
MMHWVAVWIQTGSQLTKAEFQAKAFLAPEPGGTCLRHQHYGVWAAWRAEAWCSCCIRYFWGPKSMRQGPQLAYVIQTSCWASGGLSGTHTSNCSRRCSPISTSHDSPSVPKYLSLENHVFLTDTLSGWLTLRDGVVCGIRTLSVI